MIMWLDHKVFGNGHGLASPYFDDKFYWLSGQLYTWMGGLGAQLHSFQWRHPLASERRKLFGYEFQVFHSRRQFLWLWRDRWFAIPTPICRVSVAWARTDLPRDLNEANAELRHMATQVGNSMPIRSEKLWAPAMVGETR
ncbi:MAG: hypothetical protein CFE29_03590 [Bradyrhizobiaceae bacterium PARB1]|jgi:hypothetical protein|nr:MAG: hypothetical protein CFE29_03590 [Bradyrhizobiaceae bacterium PARB1]